MTADGYRVEFAGTARRGMNRLRERAAAAAIEFCFGPLAATSHRVGTPLARELAGQYTARRGEYRVIYRIDDSARMVQVLRVDHRRESYRPH